MNNQIEKHKREKRKKIISYVIFFAFWTILILSIYICGKIRTNEIENNKAFTTGQITNYNEIPNSYVLEYTYTVNEVTYKDVSTGQSIAKNNYNYFKGKYFPVVYSAINPQKAEILITPYAFEAWGLTFPDSLEWVKDYLYF